MHLLWGNFLLVNDVLKQLLSQLICVSVFGSANHLQLPMHEVTFSTIDKPKVLSQVHTRYCALGTSLAHESAASEDVLEVF